MTNHSTHSSWLVVTLFAAVVVFAGCGGNESITPVGINPMRDCDACGGTGRIEGSCAICKGDGHRTSGIVGGSAIMCNACGGTGTVAILCHTCGGTGRVRIPIDAPSSSQQTANSPLAEEIAK